MKVFCVVALLALLGLASAQIWTPVCISLHCAGQWSKCLADKQCRDAIGCNAKCVLDKVEANKCNLLCELNHGYNNSIYKAALQCGVSHKCFVPPTKPDGVCLVIDNADPRLDKNVTDLASVEGQWWILKGLNCGQNDSWAAGFDYLPCQYDKFLRNSPSNIDASPWIDDIGYCGGEANICALTYADTTIQTGIVGSTDMLHTVADVKISSPGVMSHVYTDPPLTPQNEEWKVLSHPHPDWMLYIYCGFTPMGPYAGASVVVRENVVGDGRAHPTKSIADMPPWVEAVFREKARAVGIDYDHDWCDSDVRGCTYRA